MMKFYKRRSIQFIFSALLLVGISACNKDISLSLDNSRDESMGLVPIDSFQVSTSTFQLRDIPTSATSSILVGKTSNTISGSIKSTSYMRLATMPTAILPTDATYDSISFVLQPNKYYSGDTTATQTIAVHRVTKPIVLTEVNSGADISEKPVFVSTAAIYNHQKFDYEQNALGTISFKPFVRKLDSIAIKLDDNLGNTLFNYIKEGNSRITSDESFADYFNGIALVPGETNSAIIGFTDTVSMQIHYSAINSDGFKVNAVAEFKLGNKSYQFNNVEADRRGTAFESLSLTAPDLKSTLTDGEVFLEGSTGTVIKLNFPSLLNLVNDPTVAINKAELVIETEPSYNESYFKSPTSLILMVANAGGNPISMVNSPFSSTIQQVPYVAAQDFGMNAKYTFNMIEYFNQIRLDSYYNTSLFVSLPTTGLFSTVDRLIVAKDASNKPKIKLNILYTKF